MWITSSIKAAKTPANIALGNFDGVHLGHQRVMAQVLGTLHRKEAEGLARQISTSPTGLDTKLDTQSVQSLHDGAIASGHSHIYCGSQPDLAKPHVELNAAEEGASSPSSWATVVTFFPHPQEYFSGVSKPLLTPIAEKTWQLAQMGVQQLVMLPFNQSLAELNPEDFVKQILIDGLQAQHISVGNDFRFGKGRRGDAVGLAQIAAQYDIPVTRVALRQEKGNRISSSRIRQALQTGDLLEATQLLGRPYILTGRVVKGKQIGRTIGFPTANLQVPPDKYLPRTGVYSVWVYSADSAASAPQPGVMNIGNRPTVGGQSLSVEIYLLDWSGDLYGQTLTASLETFIRPEQKFDDLEQLKAQIAQDCDQARASLSH